MDQAPIPDPRSGGDLVANRRQPLELRTDDDDPRTNFDSDYDKLQYAEALRRLEYVTQVVPAGTGHHYHSRSVHTHKVAQVARAVSNRLLYAALNDRGQLSAEEKQAIVLKFGGLDPVVAAAGALVHDFGHPPFGHAGEAGLDTIAKRIWGIKDSAAPRLSFEGNAQSLRIILALEQHQHDNEGLELTNATVNASLKYPWAFDDKTKKYGAYGSERKRLMDARGYVREDLGDRRTLEAQIVDIADDISYAVHDVEDFYRVGLIPLGQFLGSDHGPLLEAIKRSWYDQIWEVAHHTVGVDKIHSLSRDELVSASPEDFPPEVRDGVAQAKRVVGELPTENRIKDVLRSQLNIASPLATFDGDSKSIGAVRAFAAKMIGFLLSEVSFSDDVGARFNTNGRIVVLGLKWMAEKFVFEDPRLREMQDAERRRLEVVAEHFAGLLGLYLEPAHLDDMTCDFRGRSVESRYFESLREDHGGSDERVRESPVPPTWPARYQTRFRDELLRDLPIALAGNAGIGDDSDRAIEAKASGLSVEEVSRRGRGRLLLDTLASLSESEVDELFESLRDARSRRPPMFGQR